MKTLKEHCEAIKSFMKDNHPLDDEGYEIYEGFEIVDWYFEKNDFSNLEDWELKLFKDYTHYLCILSDGWY